MNINEYQKESIKTDVNLDKVFLGKVNNQEDVLKHHLINIASGLSTEANEVLKDVQRYCYCGKGLDKDHILEECGDVLWYISAICSHLGLSLEECMNQNLVKVIKRYSDRYYSKE